VSNLSVIERTRVPLAPPPSEFVTSTLALTRRWEDIAFRMPSQCHSNWCWAAVAEGIAKYYNPGSNCKQCRIAQRILRDPDCCNFECGTVVRFNRPHSLVAALSLIDCRATGMAPGQRLSLAELQSEIRAGRPVCARIVWTDGNPSLDIPRNGKHFVAITGYLPGTSKIRIRDPWFDDDVIDYDEFCTDYQSAGGTWTDTYLTRMGRGSCS